MHLYRPKTGPKISCDSPFKRFRLLRFLYFIELVHVVVKKCNKLHEAHGGKSGKIMRKIREMYWLGIRDFPIQRVRFPTVDRARHT